ncbi:hypothetical protein M8494_17120 [Serratia ureilytica]
MAAGIYRPQAPTWRASPGLGAGVYCVLYGVTGALIGMAGQIVLPSPATPTAPSPPSRRRCCRSASRLVAAAASWRR